MNHSRQQTTMVGSQVKRVRIAEEVPAEVAL